MKATIVNIQKFSLHDGPGIRTLVFFKGCPLRCLWCANPECINPMPEIGFNKSICNRCGKCAEICPQKTILLDENGIPRVDRDRCNACGECITVCPPKALVIYGKDIVLEKLFKEIQSDAIFYNNCSGGVTVSGGEPLLRADYVEALFELCQNANITTAIETCGYISPERLNKILQRTDFVYFDIKSVNEQRHLALTGKSNQLILANARIVANCGIQVQFRMPLIPGLNDDPDNIKETSEFLRNIHANRTPSIELMPYHRLGMGKYEALDRTYPLKGLEMASIETIELARKRFKESGIDCLVSK